MAGVGVFLFPNPYTHQSLHSVAVQDSCLKLKKQEDADKTYSVIDLFRSPRLRNTTLLLVVIW